VPGRIFAILAVWQMPHFLSLAWMYRKDYARGGFAMTSVDDDTGARTSGESLAYTLLLSPCQPHTCDISRRPESSTRSEHFASGRSTSCVMSYRFYRLRSATAARGVLTASIYYIPAVVACCSFSTDSFEHVEHLDGPAIRASMASRSRTATSPALS
jgi:heme o synthase